MENEIRAALVAALVALAVCIIAERRWATWRKRVDGDFEKRWRAGR